jgi:dipeptidyl aminopeptidase/acylaminoacyl peptidase
MEMRAMRSKIGVVAILTMVFAVAAMAQQPFSLEQVLSAPFTADLTAAKTGNRLAWTVNEQGRRNIWVAEGPSFAARQLTNYKEDDGGEISELRFTPDGNALVYVRGEGKNSAGEYANPTSNPEGVVQTVWLVRFAGGAPEKVDEGHSPRVSEHGEIAYARGGQIYVATIETNGSVKEKGKQVVVRGKNEPVEWAPDGARLLFVSDRGDHSFIGIYDRAVQGVKFILPSVDSDGDPVWSMDGKKIAFTRQPAIPRDTPQGYFIQPDRARPWAIWVADAATGEGREIWKSGAAMQDSYPYMAGDTGGGVLNWGSNDTLIFASEQDSWQQLYSQVASGGAAKLLTPGNCEVEQWSFSASRNDVLFNSNCGDVDRRHIWSVTVNGARTPQELTKGSGVEWNPVSVDGASLFAYVGSDATHPGQVYVEAMSAEKATLISSSLPASFPADRLIVPQQVIFKSGDGLEIHGQVFMPKNLRAGEKRPALIFLHGGPMRQMLLGWHYMYYYANAYSMNQYLANRGYIVLAINYRSGIGYGRAFREAPGRAGRGATEYQDVVAGGKYLQTRSDVDAKRIGLWGGSYGGLLTAMGLARNSDLFAAGADFHGVHDWPTDNWEGKNVSPELNKLAHESSPVASVDTWKSPVLFIHGDDDRNVIFSQTVDLVARLRARGVSVEQLIFPDDVHDFLLYRNWLKGYQASSDFFDRQFAMPAK